MSLLSKIIDLRLSKVAKVFMVLCAHPNVRSIRVVLKSEPPAGGGCPQGW
jgi:hypothetical protein